MGTGVGEGQEGAVRRSCGWRAVRRRRGDKTGTEWNSEYKSCGVVTTKVERREHEVERWEVGGRECVEGSVRAGVDGKEQMIFGSFGRWK